MKPLIQDHTASERWSWDTQLLLQSLFPNSLLFFMPSRAEPLPLALFHCPSRPYFFFLGAESPRVSWLPSALLPSLEPHASVSLFPQAHQLLPPDASSPSFPPPFLSPALLSSPFPSPPSPLSLHPSCYCKGGRTSPWVRTD